MIVYMFLPDILALGLLLLAWACSGASSQRQQIRDFVALLSKWGLTFPRDASDAKTRESVEEAVFREAKLVFGRYHYVAVGTASGGSLLALSHLHGAWWAGLVPALWLLFFACSMMLWAGVSLDRIPRVETCQRRLSIAYILLSIALKIVTLYVPRT